MTRGARVRLGEDVVRSVRAPRELRGSMATAERTENTKKGRNPRKRPEWRAPTQQWACAEPYCQDFAILPCFSTKESPRQHEGTTRRPGTPSQGKQGGTLRHFDCNLRRSGLLEKAKEGRPGLQKAKETRNTSKRQTGQNKRTTAVFARIPRTRKRGLAVDGERPEDLENSSKSRRP